MAHPILSSRRLAGPFRRGLLLVTITAIAVFVIRTSEKALSAALWNQDFPEALAVKVELLPFLFPLHMAAGGMALVLVPLAFLLRPHRRLHHIAGRVAALDVAIAGLTAFPVAWVAPVTFWSSMGFSVQAGLWLALLLGGIARIRRGDIAGHRICMMLMLAVTSGAVVFRVLLAVWAMAIPGLGYEQFYACDAWAAWLAPLCGTAWALHRRGLSVGAGNAGALVR